MAFKLIKLGFKNKGEVITFNMNDNFSGFSLLNQEKFELFIKNNDVILNDVSKPKNEQNCIVPEDNYWFLIFKVKQIVGNWSYAG